MATVNPIWASATATLISFRCSKPQHPGSECLRARVILPIGQLGRIPVGFISADIDGDGRMDLLFTDIGNGRVGIMHAETYRCGNTRQIPLHPPVYFAAGSVCFRVRGARPRRGWPGPMWWSAIGAAAHSRCCATQASLAT